MIVASACLAACAGPAVAEGTGDPEKSKIVRQLPVPDDLQNFLERLGQPPQVRDLMEQVNKNPELKKTLADLVNRGNFSDLMKREMDNPSSRISQQLRDDWKRIPPEQREERLKDLRKQLFESTDGTGTPAPPASKAGPTLSPLRPKLGGGGDPGIQSPSPPMPASPPPSSPRNNTAIGQGIMNWARSMERIDPSLSRSPALQNVIRDLTSRIGPDDPRWQKLTASASLLKDKLSSFGQSLHLEHLAPRNGFSLPHFKGPSFPARAAIERGVAPGVPARGAGPSAPETKSWQGLLSGLVLGGLAIIVWSLLFKRAGTDSPQHASDKLGNWPVQPEAVANREDLIRAFEYLSLLALGAPARNWNHEVIAARLGDDRKTAANVPAVMTSDPHARRHAADELAALYEQARYAPGSEPLPDEALALARRDLCFLAGMAAT
jgi:hypothetical protein